MNNAAESSSINVTLNDIQLASVYYPILIDLAKHKHRLTYSELVARAKAEHPQKAFVQNAISVSTGRKLEAIRIFTAERGLPNLNCLIISKDNGECGIGFTKHYDPISTREAVFAYDWSNVTSDFEGYIRRSEKSVTPKKSIKRPEAREIMAQYYLRNKSHLPAVVIKRRERIIQLIMQGLTDDDAFAKAVEEPAES